MPLISGLLAACPQRNTAGAMLFLQEPIYQLTRPAAKTPTVIAGVVDTSALLDNNTPLRPSDCSPSKGEQDFLVSGPVAELAQPLKNNPAGIW